MGRKSRSGEFLGSGIASGHAPEFVQRRRIRANESTAGVVTAAARRVVFIIGSGRAGSHSLGWICEAQPELSVTTERPPILEWVTEAAIAPDRVAFLPPELVRRFAGELATAFLRAEFIGVHRSVHGTVASRLQHPGVLHWVREWQRDPVPNRFLGTTPGWAEHYADLSLLARCAVRWQAREIQLDALRQRPGERFLGITSEDVLADPAEEIARIQFLLGLNLPFPAPEIKHDSLDRWRNELAAVDIADIGYAINTNDSFVTS